MAANKLNATQKRFIVMELAMFATPGEVVDRVLEEYGIKITRQGVQVYDPMSAAGHGLSKELRDLFDETRKAFRRDTESIPIANRAYRLRMLDRMARDAVKQGNRQLAAQIFEQASKEVGGAFTNRRELSGPGGRPIEFDDTSGLSPEGRRARIAELLGGAQADAGDTGG